MGKATRWFKSLIGLKKQPDKENKPPNMGYEKRCSFTKMDNRKDVNNQWLIENERNKHAIAVAAATAAAADAAVAAAQAAVAVVRLTGQNRGLLFFGGREKFAAVKIQTLFRGYLARKALRALKGLVKLQAHVRGFLVRKRAAATLHSMQALIRAQASVRSQRVNRAFNKNKFQSDYRPRRSIDKFEEITNPFHSKRLSTSYESYNNAYEGSPKIVEVDTYKPRSRSRRINPSSYDFSSEDSQYPTMSSPLPAPIPIRLSIPTNHDYEWSFYGDECRISTAQSTPRLANSIQSHGPMTPTKSVCGESFFRPYSNSPSYMANTQSFRAKVRSQSAPKQRPEARPKKKLSLDDIMAARNSISGVRMQRSSSQVHVALNF